MFKIQVLIAINSWFLDNIFPLSAPEKVAGLMGIGGMRGSGKKKDFSRLCVKFLIVPFIY